MFSEILKITPKVEGKDLSNMERLLNSRFANVAKKFGGGIMNVLKGGGIAGVAIALIDRVLNPLKEVQESIEKSLDKGNDLAVFAKQFGTTAGNLARLQAFGKAKGLDPEGVRMLLVKFQGAVATAALNPDDPSAVKNYVGRKDTAESFFEFIQSMQKLNPTIQNLVQQQVFGERQILRASEFLQQNFKETGQFLSGGPSTQQITASAEWLSKMQEHREAGTARRDLFDIPTKAHAINDNTVNRLNLGEDIALARENKRLTQFDQLDRISKATEKMEKLFEDAYLKLAPAISTYLPMLIDQIVGSAKALEKSRAVRGVLPGQGKEK